MITDSQKNSIYNMLKSLFNIKSMPPEQAQAHVDFCSHFFMNALNPNSTYEPKYDPYLLYYKKGMTWEHFSDLSALFSALSESPSFYENDGAINMSLTEFQNDCLKKYTSKEYPDLKSNNPIFNEENITSFCAIYEALKGNNDLFLELFSLNDEVLPQHDKYQEIILDCVNKCFEESEYNNNLQEWGWDYSRIKDLLPKQNLANASNISTDTVNNQQHSDNNSENQKTSNPEVNKDKHYSEKDHQALFNALKRREGNDSKNDLRKIKENLRLSNLKSQEDADKLWKKRMDDLEETRVNVNIARTLCSLYSSIEASKVNEHHLIKERTNTVKKETTNVSLVETLESFQNFTNPCSNNKQQHLKEQMSETSNVSVSDRCKEFEYASPPSTNSNNASSLGNRKPKGHIIINFK